VLHEVNIAETKGGGSRTYYVPGAGFLSAPSAPLGELPGIVANSHQLNENSHQPVLDSRHPLATVPAELATCIPKPSSKPRREVRRSLIIVLCRWQALSARELATILHGREHKPLVRDYLSPMVAEGLLAYTIPEMENHPDQRYGLPAENTEAQP
jgi:ATP-dependent DNA helicase RecG